MAASREVVLRGGRPATPSAPRICASCAMAGWDFRAYMAVSHVLK